MDTIQFKSLLEISGNPIKLMRQGRNFGIKAVKTFFVIVVSVAALNLLFFFAGIYQAVDAGLNLKNLLLILFVLLLGTGMCLYAAFRAYKIILSDTLKVIYEGLSPMLKTVCVRLIDKASGTFYRSAEFSETKIENLVDVDVILAEIYGKVPLIVQRGIFRLLNKVPFLEMLSKLRAVIMQGNKEEAAEKLYQEMDSFIRLNLFSSNRFAWMGILLAFNIIVQLLIVFYGID